MNAISKFGQQALNGRAPAPVADSEQQAWIAAIATTRDKRAFAELYRFYGPKLKAYVMRAGTDAQAAEEITQEAMIAVWRKAASFDRSKASVSTWLFTIVRNKRIDMLRREGRPDLTAEDFIHLEPDQGAPEDGVFLDQAGSLLGEQLRDLPDEQAEVIRKAYFEDKSHQAIAEELALPLGTVKSRIRLGLSRLRSGMKELV